MYNYVMGIEKCFCICFYKSINILCVYLFDLNVMSTQNIL